MAASTALASLAASSNAQLTRTLERILEEAQNTGELRLNGRKLKELPSYAAKYDLRDTVHADLSKNRLAEFPVELCGLALLERLDCHSNVLRTVPPALAALQALTYLDLSRNQLTRLPGSLCQLPVLSVLLVSNNRLASLPEELGKLRSLMDLDASCNDLERLPAGVGELQLLRSLRVRRNRLQELPPELCRLRLWRLDVSENRLGRLPPPLRLMGSLRHLLLDGNPLVCPPAFLCRRGQVHVFKYLELEALKEDRRKGHLLDSADGRPGRGMVEHCAVNGHIAADSKRSVDSGISDGGDSQRWSFDAPCSLRSQEDPSQLWLPSENGGGGGPTTPSTLSPCSETGPLHRGAFFEDQLDSGDSCGPGLPSELQNGQSAPSSQEGSPNQNHSPPAENGGLIGACEPSRLAGAGVKEAPAPPRRVQHQQTYREFKEALRQQRLAPVQPQQITAHQQQQQPQHRVTPEEEFRARHEAIVQRLEASWAQQRSSQPSSPLPTPPPGSSGARTPMRAAATTPPALVSGHMGGDFTIRRGLERAREEQELVEQLRWAIESRLKVQLPPEVGPSLVDGVVLCHLANQVQPRAVASIHVPSAATPKLTLAKCRRNVENFLNACRQLGVPEGDLFAWEDLVLRVDVARVAATVSALAPAASVAPGLRRGDRPLAHMLLATLAGTCLLLLWGTDPWWLPVGLCCGPYLHALLRHSPAGPSCSSSVPPHR
ncbi:leucine-rich-repeats and calponin homology domain protein isoform X2 [Haemaphysalis longicornis]